MAPIGNLVKLTSDEKRKDVEMNQDSTIEDRARATKNDPLAQRAAGGKQ